MRRAVVRTHGIAAVLPDPALLADAGPRVAAVPVVPAVQRAELRAARAAVAATAEQSAEAHQRAVAWGEQIAQQEGVARSSLETTHSAIGEAQARLKQLQHVEQTKQVQL